LKSQIVISISNLAAALGVTAAEQSGSFPSSRTGFAANFRMKPSDESGEDLRGWERPAFA
jgi:hypothetical protein